LIILKILLGLCLGGAMFNWAAYGFFLFQASPEAQRQAGIYQSQLGLWLITCLFIVGIDYFLQSCKKNKQPLE